MRHRSAFSSLSVLILVLAASLMGHGWGQVQAFGAPDIRGQLSAPVADDISLRPDAARLAQIATGDDLADPALVPQARSTAPERIALVLITAISVSPVETPVHRRQSPRAPPIA